MLGYDYDIYNFPDDENYIALKNKKILVITKFELVLHDSNIDTIQISNDEIIFNNASIDIFCENYIKEKINSYQNQKINKDLIKKYETINFFSKCKHYDFILYLNTYLPKYEECMVKNIIYPFILCSNKIRITEDYVREQSSINNNIFGGSSLLMYKFSKGILDQVFKCCFTESKLLFDYISQHYYMFSVIPSSFKNSIYNIHKIQSFEDCMYYNFINALDKDEIKALQFGKSLFSNDDYLNKDGNHKINFHKWCQLLKKYNGDDYIKQLLSKKLESSP